MRVSYISSCRHHWSPYINKQKRREKAMGCCEVGNFHVSSYGYHTTTHSPPLVHKQNTEQSWTCTTQRQVPSWKKRVANVVQCNCHSTLDGGAHKLENGTLVKTSRHTNDTRQTTKRKNYKEQGFITTEQAQGKRDTRVVALNVKPTARPLETHFECLSLVCTSYRSTMSNKQRWKHDAGEIREVWRNGGVI